MPVPEPMPGYGQLLRRGYGSLAGAVRGCGDCGWELARRSWAENAHLGWAELLLCGLCALGWTALRRTAARWVFRVSAGPPRGNGAPAGCGMGTPGTGWMRDGGGGERRDAAPVAPEGSFLRYPCPHPRGWLCRKRHLASPRASCWGGHGRRDPPFPQGFVLGGCSMREPSSLGAVFWRI